jgi:hypothetical protein
VNYDKEKITETAYKIAKEELRQREGDADNDSRLAHN